MPASGALYAVGKSIEKAEKAEKAEKKEQKAKKLEKVDEKVGAQLETDASQIPPAETAPHTAEDSPAGVDNGEYIEQPLDEV